MSVSILETAVTIQRYVVQNIAETGLTVSDINVFDDKFDDSNKSKWIALDTYPVANNLIAVNGTVAGVQELLTTVDIYCYNTNKKNTYGLVDDVKSMLENRELDNGVIVRLGTPQPPNKLQNNVWECVVSFSVTQSG
jgi:hypothetical protein